MPILSKKQYNVGDLQVRHIPQVPMEAFAVDVDSLEEAIKLLEVLADYDLFQFKHNIKPDYCNIGGLAVWVADTFGGVPGWIEWHHPETDEDIHAYTESRASIANVAESSTL